MTKSHSILTRLIGYSSHLSCSATLHEYSVKELIRNGIDKVNGAISRMQKERRANLPKMNASQKRLYSRQMIEVRDMRALNLNEDIGSTDTGITKLRKAVARELQLASDTTKVVPPIARRRREKKAPRPRKNLDDRHCHASRKRRRQRGSKISGDRSIDIRLDAADKSAIAERSRNGEVDSGTSSSASDDDDDLVLSALEKREPARSSIVQFVGETDETDTNQSSYLPAAKRQRRAGSSQGRRAGGSGVFDDNRSRSSHRPPKSDADRMLEWCSKQNQPDIRSLQHDQEARGSKPRRRADAAAGGSSRNGLQARSMINSGSRRSNDSAEEEPSGREKSKGTTGTTRSRPSELAPTTRPQVSKHLSLDRLFSQLEARGCNIRAEAIPRVTETKTVSELCAELKHFTRTNETRVSREILKQLGSVVHHEGDGIQDCDVALLYETMEIVLKHKCSTLLDLIQSVPESFFVQVECWHVVFLMAEKKLHRRGSEGSAGLRNAKNCANHILLQVVDALYSQLLWEEYGLPSPSFRDIVFEYLKSLCAAVNRVLPLIPAVYELLTSKKIGLGPLHWRLSRMTERKENDPESILFVSAVDPALHVNYISTGEPIQCSQGKLPMPTQSTC